MEWIFASSLFLVVVIAAYLYSLKKDHDKTDVAATYVYNNIFDIFVILIAISGIMGIFEVLFPSWVFAEISLFKGWKMVLTAIGGGIIGSVTPGPPVLAYPIARTMMEEGLRLGVIATFLTAWSLIDPITFPVEVRYLGKKFALWRMLVSFALAIAIGIPMIMLF